MRNVLITLLVVAALVGCEKQESAERPPLTVTATPIVTKEVTAYRSWVGLLNGFQNADVRAQVTGYLISQDYKEGTPVKKDAVLFKIDERPFRAVVAAAQADYARTVAQAQLAQITEQRQSDLFTKKAISSQDYDVAKQNYQSALALAAAAQAQVQSAQVNLDYCTIRAPFDGIVGTAQAQVGSLVGPGGSAAVLTQISQVDPIKACFSITESQFLQIAPHMEEWREASKNKELDNDISITLSNGQEYPQKGHLHLFNRQIDASTGTISVETLFPNPEGLLRPGLFVRVTIPVRTEKDALLVPQQALVEVQGISMLSILKEDDTVQTIPVKKGEVQGPDIVVHSPHLKAGMRAIVGGAEKVRPNMKVKVAPYEVSNLN